LESLDSWTDPAVADGKALQLDDGKIVLDAWGVKHGQEGVVVENMLLLERW
jgi:hypothetical protein